MGRAKKSVAVATVVVACLSGNLVIAGAAAAKTSGPKPPGLTGPRPPAFTVEASNGYLVTVSSTRRGAVKLIAFRGLESSSFDGVQYTTQGQVTRRKIRANFGPIGKVSVRFKPSGRIMHSPRFCEMARTVETRGGSFKGRIEFRGEGGYSVASASRAAATPTPNLTTGPICSLLAAAAKTPGAAHLSVARPNESAFFIAVNAGPGTEGLLEGVVTERRTRIRIVRAVGVVAPPNVFTTDPSLTVADVQEPPSPFIGMAHFQSSSPFEPGTWTGTLQASFPGGSSVGLAGQDFSGGLDRYDLSD